MTPRYVHGAGADAPLIWYQGAGTAAADRRFLLADQQGSIVAVADNAGQRLAVNAYDEYGIPGATHMGRFAYTGQIRLPEIGMYYYKARMYSAGLGRLLQTDPIGYAGGINLYAYVGNDPINALDPDGRETCVGTPAQCTAYREALTLARAAADSPTLTARDRLDLRNLTENIRADRSYIILFAPKEFIDRQTNYRGFSYTNVTERGTIYTVLPNDFDQLYESYPGRVAEAERAGVVVHEGSHKEDYQRGAVRRGDRFSRSSPTERRADRRQDIIVTAAERVCITGSRICR